MVEIKITGDTPMEALASLTAFGLRCLCDPEVSAAAHRILADERSKESKKIGAEAVTPTPGTPTSGPRMPPAEAEAPPESYPAEEPPADPAPDQDPQPVEERDAPTYTIEQIREKGTAAARAHGNVAVKAILKGLGVEGMSALKKEQYPTFLKKLAALDEEGDTYA